MSAYRKNYNSYKPRSIRKSENRNKKRLIFTLIIIIVSLYLIFVWGIPYLIGGLTYFNKPSTVKNPPVSEDTSLAPPIFNIPYEATNTATLKISGYAIPKAKVEIYIDDELKDTADTQDNGAFTSLEIPLSLGTNNITGKTVDPSGKKSLASKNIVVTYSNEKPKLEISEPEDNKQIKGGDKKVRVSGNSDPDNNVTINGYTVILNGDGHFSKEIEITEGDNQITISAVNSVGNSTQIQKKVTYAP